MMRGAGFQISEPGIFHEWGASRIWEENAVVTPLLGEERLESGEEDPKTWKARLRRSCWHYVHAVAQPVDRRWEDRRREDRRREGALMQIRDTHADRFSCGCDNY